MTCHFPKSLFLVTYSIFYAANNLCVYEYAYTYLAVCPQDSQHLHGMLGLSRLITLSMPWRPSNYLLMELILNSGVLIPREEMPWPSEDLLPQESAGHKAWDTLFPLAMCFRTTVGRAQSLIYTLGHSLESVHIL